MTAGAIGRSIPKNQCPGGPRIWNVDVHRLQFIGCIYEEFFYQTADAADVGN
jgi:hypothetical protein